jgi:hypothetical protein
MRAFDNWSETHSGASGPPNVNVTVVSKALTFDPFDSYSILKPAERDWLIPRPSRRPFVIAALLIIMFVGVVVAFSDSSGWASLATEAVNYVQPTQNIINANSSSPQKIDVSHLREQQGMASVKDVQRDQRLRKLQNINSANKSKSSGKRTK